MDHPLRRDPLVRELERRCRENGIELAFVREIQNGIQLNASRRSDRLTINVYRGKAGVRVVLQGSGPLRDELEPESAESPWKSWIGSDESGKGDYFGPLVVAAVRVDSAAARQLAALGVKDSKRLSDARIETLDRNIRDSCRVEVAQIDPPEYNRAHRQVRNVNRILGQAHARVIERLLEQADAEAAVADQFGDESYIERELGPLGKKIRLIQRPRAESDVAVAAASVVARAAFVRALAALSSSFDVEFPKGAGADVLRAARAFVDAHGRRALSRAAKVHFKTSLQI